MRLRGEEQTPLNNISNFIMKEPKTPKTTEPIKKRIRGKGVDAENSQMKNKSSTIISTSKELRRTRSQHSKKMKIPDPANGFEYTLTEAAKLYSV
jgi:hypothetical protein